MVVKKYSNKKMITKISYWPRVRVRNTVIVKENINNQPTKGKVRGNSKSKNKKNQPVKNCLRAKVTLYALVFSFKKAPSENWRREKVS